MAVSVKEKLIEWELEKFQTLFNYMISCTLKVTQTGNEIEIIFNNK